MTAARFVCLLALALLAGVAPAAAALDDRDFGSIVPGSAGKTWIDLLAQIFPDIAVGSRGYATASKLIDLRSIGDVLALGSRRCGKKNGKLLL